MKPQHGAGEQEPSGCLSVIARNTSSSQLWRTGTAEWLPVLLLLLSCQTELLLQCDYRGNLASSRAASQCSPSCVAKRQAGERHAVLAAGRDWPSGARELRAGDRQAAGHHRHHRPEQGEGASAATPDAVALPPRLLAEQMLTSAKTRSACGLQRRRQPPLHPRLPVLASLGAECKDQGHDSEHNGTVWELYVCTLAAGAG